METKSFTLRLPIEVFNAITEQAEEGKRSEFIIQLLRESLGLESEEEKTRRIDALRVADQVNELAYRIEAMQTKYDIVIQRLAELEAVLQEKTESKTGSALQSKAESTANEPVLQKIAISKTVEETKNLELLPEDTIIPDSAEKMNSAALLRRLREIDKKWNVHRLKYFREGRKKDSWHQVSRYRFKLAEQENGAKYPTYYWWVVTLEG